MGNYTFQPLNVTIFKGVLFGSGGIEVFIYNIAEKIIEGTNHSEFISRCACCYTVKYFLCQQSLLGACREIFIYKIFAGCQAFKEKAATEGF